MGLPVCVGPQLSVEGAPVCVCASSSAEGLQGSIFMCACV